MLSTRQDTHASGKLDRSEQEAGLPQIFTPWSDNETLLMYRLFPNPDSLCLNFGRTGVFQWNHPNSSAMTHTTEWPQQVAGHYLRTGMLAGPTQTWVEPHPHMPYAIFRNMGPHFHSYANSGIPDIIGTELELFCGSEQSTQLLYLLPHLQLIDVGTTMGHRLEDLQTVFKCTLYVRVNTSVGAHACVRVRDMSTHTRTLYRVVLEQNA